jgi:hypothetical protein
MSARRSRVAICCDEKYDASVIATASTASVCGSGVFGLSPSVHGTGAGNAGAALVLCCARSSLGATEAAKNAWINSRLRIGIVSPKSIRALLLKPGEL